MGLKGDFAEAEEVFPCDTYPEDVFVMKSRLGEYARYRALWKFRRNHWDVISGTRIDTSLVCLILCDKTVLTEKHVYRTLGLSLKIPCHQLYYEGLTKAINETAVSLKRHSNGLKIHQFPLTDLFRVCIWLAFQFLPLFFDWVPLSSLPGLFQATIIDPRNRKLPIVFPFPSSNLTEMVSDEEVVRINERRTRNDQDGSQTLSRSQGSLIQSLRRPRLGYAPAPNVDAAGMFGRPVFGFSETINRQLLGLAQRHLLSIHHATREWTLASWMDFFERLNVGALGFRIPTYLQQILQPADPVREAEMPPAVEQYMLLQCEKLEHAQIMTLLGLDGFTQLPEIVQEQTQPVPVPQPVQQDILEMWAHLELMLPTEYRLPRVLPRQIQQRLVRMAEVQAGGPEEARSRARVVLARITMDEMQATVPLSTATQAVQSMLPPTPILPSRMTLSPIQPVPSRQMQVLSEAGLSSQVPLSPRQEPPVVQRRRAQNSSPRSAPPRTVPTANERARLHIGPRSSSSSSSSLGYSSGNSSVPEPVLQLVFKHNSLWILFYLLRVQMEALEMDGG